MDKEYWQFHILAAHKLEGTFIPSRALTEVQANELGGRIHNMVSGRGAIHVVVNRERTWPSNRFLPPELHDALRAYHAGADRGELMALLVEKWGLSPPRVGG